MLLLFHRCCCQSQALLFQETNLVQRSPDAITYKKKPLSNAQELYKLFEGSLATGDNAYATGEVGLPEDHVVIDEDDSHMVSDDTNPTQVPNVEVNYSYWDNIHVITPPVISQPSTPHFKQGGTSSAASDSSKNKRKKVVEDESDAVQELIDVVKNLVTHMELERIEEKRNMESYSMPICMGILDYLKEFEQLAGDVYMGAMMKLATSKEFRKAFIELEDMEQKKIFLMGLVSIKV